MQMVNSPTRSALSSPEDTLSDPTPQRPDKIEPNSTACVSTASLSSERRSLLRLLRSIAFGRIENLRVRGGEPIVDSDTRWVRVVKLNAVRQDEGSGSTDEYIIKAHVAALFREFELLQDGLILRVEVRHGLPVLAEVFEGTPHGELSRLTEQA
jgi:hypothetical protein